MTAARIILPYPVGQGFNLSDRRDSDTRYITRRRNFGQNRSDTAQQRCEGTMLTTFPVVDAITRRDVSGIWIWFEYQLANERTIVNTHTAK